MKKLTAVILLAIFTASIQAQETLQSKSWKKYNVRTQIAIGGVNVGYLGFMTLKQEYMPVKTQKIVVPVVSCLVIGFTFYKGIEYNKRRPVTKRANYKG